MSQTVKVEIYDHAYQLRTDQDPAYVEELARFVDAKMREVADATRTVDSFRVATLAAITIADELHALRRQKTELESAVREHTERALSQLNLSMKQSA